MRQEQGEGRAGGGALAWRRSGDRPTVTAALVSGVRRRSGSGLLLIQTSEAAGSSRVRRLATGSLGPRLAVAGLQGRDEVGAGRTRGATPFAAGICAVAASH